MGKWHCGFPWLGTLPWVVVLTSYAAMYRISLSWLVDVACHRV